MQECLAKAQAEVAQVGQLLLSPTTEALDQCTPSLQAAIAEMKAGRLELCQRAPHDREFEQALQLRESVRRARVLLDSAARFHHNWIRRRDAMLGGYAQDGQPAASSTRGLLAIEG